MNAEEIKKIVEQITSGMDVKTAAAPSHESMNNEGGAFSKAVGPQSAGAGEITTVADDVLAAEKRPVQDDGVIDDIRLVDWRKITLVPNMRNEAEYMRFKAHTDARLAVGRAGVRYKTDPWLRLLADHAGSVDAVQRDPSDEIIDRNGFFRIQSECPDKETYLSRPDLGRLLSDETKQKLRDNCIQNADVQVIASEGLSSTAFDQNIDDLMKSMNDGFKVEGFKVGTPIYIKYSRVPTEDQVTEALNPKVTIILIGERPGMSTFSSLSAYMTYGGHVGLEESKRTVISNIFDKGTSPLEAGAHIASIAKLMIEQKASGTDLDLK
jgi:ethanolamine ammonia-lyase small subunit